MCQATAIGAMVILLFMSRACYNLVVVALTPQDRFSPFNYGWYSVSDQVLYHVCSVIDISPVCVRVCVRMRVCRQSI